MSPETKPHAVNPSAVGKPEEVIATPKPSNESVAKPQPSKIILPDIPKAPATPKVNSQPVFSGYAGANCTHGDILFANYATHNLDTNEAYTIGPTIVTGALHVLGILSVKYGCAPEHIEGEIKPKAKRK